MAVNIIDRTGADALIPLEISREIIKETPQSSKLLPLMKRLPDMTAKQRVLPGTKNITAGILFERRHRSKADNKR